MPKAIQITQSVRLQFAWCHLLGCTPHHPPLKVNVSLHGKGFRVVIIVIYIQFSFSLDVTFPLRTQHYRNAVLGVVVSMTKARLQHQLGKVPICVWEITFPGLYWPGYNNKCQQGFWLCPLAGEVWGEWEKIESIYHNHTFVSSLVSF